MATQSIHLATTVQHVRGQGCLEEGDLLWRVQLRGSAEKRDRAQHGSGSPEGSRQPTVGGGRRRFAPLRRCAARRGAADRDGVAFAAARRTKERTYPELVGPGSRARLVVLALEVGGRWSEEAKLFVRLLARARARSEPRLTQRRVEQAWRLRWYAIISCAAAKSFAASLLGWRGGHGSDGLALPSHEVERDQAVALGE